jgi:hypothetical protein
MVTLLCSILLAVQANAALFECQDAPNYNQGLYTPVPAYNQGLYTPAPYAAPAVSPSSTMLQYGNGLPAPSKSAVSYFPTFNSTANPDNGSAAPTPCASKSMSTLIANSSTAVEPSHTSFRVRLSQFSFPTPSTVRPSSTFLTPSAVLPSPTPTAPSSSSLVIPVFTYRELSQTSSQASQTNLVIIPISTVTTMLLKRDAMPTAEVFQARDIDWAAELGQRAAASTLTLKTTIETSALPSFELVSPTRKASPTSSAAKSSKVSNAPAPSTSKSSVTVTASSQSGGPTSAPTYADKRCPYPYPGIKCDGKKSTLETKSSRKPETTMMENKPTSTTMANKPTSTEMKNKPTSSSWCPYPGQKC